MAPKAKDKAKASNAKDTKTKDTKSKSKDTASSSTKSGSGSGGQSLQIRHILCAKHSRKEEALTKLNNGAKFDEVAREFSEDKARQGGSLGWKTKGELLPEFEQCAWALSTSTTSKPAWGECKTSEGYHIVMVEGRK